MTRYPYGLGAAFWGGAVVSSIVYAVISVYGFGFIESAWGMTASFQVVLLLAVALSTVGALAFGLTLAFAQAPSNMSQPGSPRAIAMAVGAACFAVAWGVVFLVQAEGSFILAVGIFVVVAMVSALLYRYRYLVPKHAAS